MRWWRRWWKGPLLWWGKPPSRHPTLLSASVTECILGNDRRAGSPTSSIMIASRNLTNVSESISNWSRVLGGLNPTSRWRGAIFGLIGTEGNIMIWCGLVYDVAALECGKLLRFEPRDTAQHMNQLPRLARTNQLVNSLHRNKTYERASKWCVGVVEFNWNWNLASKEEYIIWALLPIPCTLMNQLLENLSRLAYTLLGT